jgi:hypothetical protein
MNIKKIIVKEGLILIGIFAVSFSLCLLGNILSHPGEGNGFDQAVFQRQFEIIAFYLYPLYLLLHLIIRFIIWAKDIKNMPARAGLVLLGCILVGCVMLGLAKIGFHFYDLFLKQKQFLHHAIITFLDSYYRLKQFSIVIAIFGYPAYWLVSFIVRAIKALKNEGR